MNNKDQNINERRGGLFDCLPHLVGRREWTKWEDLKVQQSEYGDYRIIQQRRCKKTGKVQLRSANSG